MIHRTIIRCGVLPLLLLLAPCAAVQASTIYIANLTGANEYPSNASPGSGTAMVEYDAIAQILQVDAQFSDLTADNTAAHIHCCVSPSGSPPTAGVATPTPTFPGFPTGVTSGTYSQAFDLTSTSSFNGSFVTANGGTAAGAEAALAAGLANGEAYFNIHTSNFPGGEIRGFLAPAPVPIPAAVWLFSSGLLGLIGIARKKK